MWELLNKILEYKITPDACLFLFSIKQKVISQNVDHEKCIENLIDAKMITYEDNNGVKKFTITPQGKAFIAKLDNYFIKAKKKTNIQLMGEDYANNIEAYRSIFPKGKLPSGVPARNNVKALGTAFRWFFESYDYTWDEVFKATKLYVHEYEKENYMYMMNSQYFISKQDKHRVKKSTLADYCDMIRDGVTTEEDHFKVKVV